MSGRIDINQADEEVLASLPGIGAGLAARIVDYRSNVHLFAEVIELSAVPGISERMVRAIAGQLTVNGAVEGISGTPVEVDGDDVRLEPDERTDDSLEAVEAESADEPVVVRVLPPEGREPERVSMPVPVVSEPVGGTAAERSERVVERTVVTSTPRRHVHFWQQFFGVVAGAFFGSVLTLALLYLLNGTLRYAGDSRTTSLQLQVDEEMSGIRQSQSSLADELGGLSGQVVELGNEQAEVEDRVAAVDANVENLEAETAALHEQVEAINLTAEKFDAFLTGLRDLLVTLQGLPAVPSATVTITATSTITISPTPAESAGTPTLAAATGTPDGALPTRTPRPTATPLLGE